MFGDGDSGGGGDDGGGGADVKGGKAVTAGAASVEESVDARRDAGGALAHGASGADEFLDRFSFESHGRQKGGDESGVANAIHHGSDGVGGGGFIKVAFVEKLMQRVSDRVFSQEFAPAE